MTHGCIIRKCVKVSTRKQVSLALKFYVSKRILSEIILILIFLSLSSLHSSPEDIITPNYTWIGRGNSNHLERLGDQYFVGS